MVYFFETWLVDDNPESDKFLMYMGKDKFENEDLIKYGWPEDVWFHVSDLSSAHVYLRLPAGMTIESIPAKIVTDCAQLCKANSIEGNKQKVKVCYTMWKNLHKKNGMDTGQIGFHDEKAMKYVDLPTRENAIVNRINKTRTEKEPSAFKADREARDVAERAKFKQMKKKKETEAAKAKEAKEKEKQAKSYDKLMKKENMRSNAKQTKTAAEYEDDFM